jgi:3-oxoacyl-ACP reductase-like protein
LTVGRQYGGTAAPPGIPAAEDIMTRRLESKLALVTAAGQGIGCAIAEVFLAEGSKVIATSSATGAEV